MHNYLRELFGGVKFALRAQKLIKTGFYILAVKVAREADYVGLTHNVSTVAEGWMRSDV